jgi:hypothetical protein
MTVPPASGRAVGPRNYQILVSVTIEVGTMEGVTANHPAPLPQSVCHVK